MGITLLISPAQEAVESSDVTLQPPFLQTRQGRSSQWLLREQIFQHPHQPCCPALDAFK